MEVLSLLKRSIRAQLLAAALVPLVVLVLFSAIFFPLRQRALSFEVATNEVATLSEMLAFSVGAGLGEGSYDLVQEAFDWAKKNPHVRYIAILDETGAPIFDHDPEELGLDLEAVLAQQGAERQGTLIRAAAPVTFQEEALGDVVLAYSLEQFNAQVNNSLMVALLVNLLLLGVGGGLIVVIARRLSGRIVGLRDAARAVGEGQLKTQIDTSGEDEVGDLASSFEQMVTHPGEPIQVRFRYVHADGTWLHLEATGTNRVTDPAIAGIVINARDVSEQERAAAALRAAESKFRGMVEQSVVGTVIIQDDRFAYVNPRMAEMLDRPQEELTALDSVLDVIHPDDRELVRDKIRRRMAGELDEAHYEVRGLCPDGTVLHAEVFGTAFEFGGERAILGTLLDVTEQKRKEEELRMLGLAEGARVYDGYAFATPVTDGEHVWWKNGMGVAACFDLEGERRWLVRTGGHVAINSFADALPDGLG